MRPFVDVDRLAAAPWLDRPAGAARDAVHRVLRSRRVKNALHGVWLGHPLHPVLAQASLAGFVGAGVLDAVPRGGRPAAGLIGFGLVCAAPTAAAGWADFADGHEEQQRVGIVHAAANTVMLSGYVGSLIARARGRSAQGKVWGWAALGAGAVGGLLGGHMTYRQAMGANHAEGIPHIGPGDWTPVGPVEGVPEGVPVRRTVGDVAVVLVRGGEVVHALAERCSHASAPLSEGSLERDPEAGTCLRCPWHASAFRLADGSVVDGPATAPQPTFDTRVRDGHLEVRVHTWPGVPAS